MYLLLLSKYLNSTFWPKLPVMSVPKLLIFITIPYIENSSYHCKKQLLNIINKYFPPIYVFLLIDKLYRHFVPL